MSEAGAAMEPTIRSFSLDGPPSAEFHRLDEGLEQRLWQPDALRVVDWLREQIARPDPRVGRPGPVCPIVPMALRSATIWLGVVDYDAGEHDRGQLSALILRTRERFLQVSAESPGRLTTFLMVFPRLTEAEAVATILAVQESHRLSFLELGLMIGEFFPSNQVSSLRNDRFFPFRSPVPLLGFRHMVEEDVGFFELAARSDPARGIRCLRAYVDYFVGRNGSPTAIARARRSIEELVRTTRGEHLYIGVD